jgi:hypothetical protein
MKLDRFRAPALAATAILLISGVASAFAASPGAAVPARVPPAVQAAIPAPDSDTLRAGDQTTPDLAGATAAGVERTARAVGAATSTVRVARTAATETAAETPELTEATGAESDGAGGHQDAAGQNVDHQFNGQE